MAFYDNNNSILLCEILKIMIMKLFITLAVALALNQTSAQSLSPDVISASGAFYANNSGMLSTTIGEMTMVDTYLTGPILNQGFQQAFDFTVGISGPAVNDLFEVFPNPTTGKVNILIPASITGVIDILVFDTIGKRVFRKTEKLTGKETNILLALEQLSEGLYHIQLTTTGGLYYSKFNFIK
jgi:hypothetical protein